MEKPIRNRVAESGLIQLQLSELIEIDCVELDFTSMLHEGQVVIEKNFRTSIEVLNVASYAGKGVGLAVSDEAIIPDWAWMVLTAKLSESAFVVVGGLEGARDEALRRAIDNIDLSEYQDRRVIVRGCDKASGPEALLLFQSKIQPVVKTCLLYTSDAADDP